MEAKNFSHHTEEFLENWLDWYITMYRFIGNRNDLITNGYFYKLLDEKLRRNEC